MLYVIICTKYFSFIWVLFCFWCILWKLWNHTIRFLLFLVYFVKILSSTWTNYFRNQMHSPKRRHGIPKNFPHIFSMGIQKKNKQTNKKTNKKTKNTLFVAWVKKKEDMESTNNFDQFLVKKMVSFLTEKLGIPSFSPQFLEFPFLRSKFKPEDFQFSNSKYVSHVSPSLIFFSFFFGCL